MRKIFIYVVDRDLGFAPNPFHGLCTLATCKSRIRNAANIDDWVIGVGGRRLKATGKCIFAMKVTGKLSYDEYWLRPEFNDKKPVRNGSPKMMLGDNIYYRHAVTNDWIQAHSHHSLQDGSVNIHNLNKDTKSSQVLISSHFYYFGSSAPLIPEEILSNLKYENQINHRTYPYDHSSFIIEWIENQYGASVNLVLSDPFNFNKSGSHFSPDTNLITDIY